MAKRRHVCVSVSVSVSLAVCVKAKFKGFTVREENNCILRNIYIYMIDIRYAGTSID